MPYCQGCSNIDHLQTEGYMIICFNPANCIPGFVAEELEKVIGEGQRTKWIVHNIIHADMNRTDL